MPNFVGCIRLLPSSPQRPEARAASQPRIRSIGSGHALLQCGSGRLPSQRSALPSPSGLRAACRRQMSAAVIKASGSIPTAAGNTRRSGGVCMAAAHDPCASARSGAGSAFGVVSGVGAGSVGCAAGAVHAPAALSASFPALGPDRSVVRRAPCMRRFQANERCQQEEE